ncbi:RNA-binding S4 domain-containing protein [Pontivivens insulae]|uniref:Heat shock protein 15 n=1 Tax=Pontivivens insulae TaxID=1639689 RepID=A0A2R8ACG4_9RHOB|nr:RNA-binding S4 domain-containing protein [Pontivivens insulae]RED11097.1 ribosome-associated heat shock protein Hsp15 [Pontivivens insulae]SPF29728.1 Heat shock protein 15 [Pontivivens insulae]
MTEVAPSLRVDKWLWHARFFKTRTLAAKTVQVSGCRINGQRVSKPSSAVRVGDTLTFAKDRHIRLIRVEALGERRGPAPEAQALYTDLDPPVSEPRRIEAERVGGRPTKKDSRALDALSRED